ncbi:hypothetical protein B0H16DRAFT_1685965 [Mycena metata]|uniref:Uncharacterized protein n=1 Tax=Mycena metata TaxID=1033252 RepID=A0AAD7JUF8_9AGAR|nr:hypothetical protein B0H16DRAFT_1685965 [Mycena metata]
MLCLVIFSCQCHPPLFFSLVAPQNATNQDALKQIYLRPGSVTLVRTPDRHPSPKENFKSHIVPALFYVGLTCEMGRWMIYAREGLSLRTIIAKQCILTVDSKDSAILCTSGPQDIPQDVLLGGTRCFDDDARRAHATGKRLSCPANDGKRGRDREQILIRPHYKILRACEKRQHPPPRALRSEAVISRCEDTKRRICAFETRLAAITITLEFPEIPRGHPRFGGCGRAGATAFGFNLRTFGSEPGYRLRHTEKHLDYAYEPTLALGISSSELQHLASRLGVRVPSEMGYNCSTASFPIEINSRTRRLGYRKFARGTGSRWAGGDEGYALAIALDRDVLDRDVQADWDGNPRRFFRGGDVASFNGGSIRIILHRNTMLQI